MSLERHLQATASPLDSLSLKKRLTAGRVDEPGHPSRWPISSAPREMPSSNETASGSAGCTSKCCWPLRGVVPPHSAVISMSAPAAGIVPPSRITAAAIGIAPSVRSLLGNDGSLRVDENFSRPATCMSSSPCPTGWRHWSCRTRRSSTISCSAPVRKHFSKSLAIRDTSVQRLASSVCCTPGVRNSTFIRMSIVSFPPAASRSITPAGFAHERTTSFPNSAAEIFRGKFVAALKQAFQNGQLNFHGDLKLLAQPKTFAAWLRPLYRQDWVVYLKRPFGGPAYVLQYLGRYTHRVAISNHRLVSFADGQVTFRWRDSADHNEQKLLTLSSMSSCVASCCTCFRKVSCASATSAFWPTASVPLFCRFAFSCSARYQSRKPNNTLPPPKTPPIFGAVPSVVAR